LTLFGCCNQKDFCRLNEIRVTFKLLSGEDESLLVRRDAFFVLDFSLDSFDGVRGLDIKSDGLASEGLHENLHGYK